MRAQGIAHLSSYISHVGFDVTLQVLDVLLRSHFDIHRLGRVKIKEEVAVFVVSK